jgi:8-oxo-dGTP diphosphatase
VADTYENVAKDHAVVGAQIGRMTGGAVRVDAAGQPGELGAQLETLRLALVEARRTGQLDAATYAEARTELATALERLPAADGDGRSGFVLALRKLKGLVEDAVGLAAQVSAILAATGGLP